MSFRSEDEILDFAIEEEEDAAEFYNRLADQMEKPWMKDVFLDFANDEVRHKKLLVEIKNGKRLFPAREKIMDLKIADYVVSSPAQPDMDYQQALILAMKKEKAAFKLYQALAAQTDVEDLKNTLLAIAQEEAKHKLKVEIEYDDNFMTESGY